jgi:hypothetical protein
MPLAARLRQLGGLKRASAPRRLDEEEIARLTNALMTHLAAIPAASTVHLWWRGRNHAARWRD